ncbi:hypothetical protein AG1IA_05414 [Rhizoctonia solani AG-1 IA]|uniref:Uncharacterized protein n=1 Tax=Thanatephorus cucumeris (strain AG1-IA) TaxID=983506 RepID=L8WUW1_THACA|nr:hypothetical protein AG1IA_05414 [Rhizoctonia solani AG-1 IA]
MVAEVKWERETCKPSGLGGFIPIVSGYMVIARYQRGWGTGTKCADESWVTETRAELAGGCNDWRGMVSRRANEPVGVKDENEGAMRSGMFFYSYLMSYKRTRHTAHKTEAKYANKRKGQRRENRSRTRQERQRAREGLSTRYRCHKGVGREVIRTGRWRP